MRSDGGGPAPCSVSLRVHACILVNRHGKRSQSAPEPVSLAVHMAQSGGAAMLQSADSEIEKGVKVSLCPPSSRGSGTTDMHAAECTLA